MVVAGGCWRVAAAGAGRATQTQGAARVGLQRSGLGNICTGRPGSCPGP